MSMIVYGWLFFSLNFSDALATTLSALYGKLLVVMGTAFPMAEVISTYIPPSFYEVIKHFFLINFRHKTWLVDFP